MSASFELAQSRRAGPPSPAAGGKPGSDKGNRTWASIDLCSVLCAPCLVFSDLFAFCFLVCALRSEVCGAWMEAYQRHGERPCGILRCSAGSTVNTRGSTCPRLQVGVTTGSGVTGGLAGQHLHPACHLLPPGSYPQRKCAGPPLHLLWRRKIAAAGKEWQGGGSQGGAPLTGSSILDLSTSQTHASVDCRSGIIWVVVLVEARREVVGTNRGVEGHQPGTA